jgi:hypothetical protein
MTRPLHWSKLLISVAITFLLLVGGLVGLLCFERSGERTYYGPHTSILRVGERVDTANSRSGVAESDPAWDEDSCEPDRPIKVRLDSGELVSLPRRTLHR